MKKTHLKPQQQKRIIWLDVVRIFAIILVVATHSAGNLFWSEQISKIMWSTDDIFIAFVRIAVPLFVMVSGALLLSRTEPYTTFFTKRIAKVILPWIAWTGIYILWNIYYHNADISTPYMFLKHAYVTFMSQFWFIPMILGLYALTPFLRIFITTASKRDIIYLLSIWLLAYSIYPLFQLILRPEYTMPVPFVLEHIGYFLLGYLLLKWFSHPPATWALCLILFISVFANSLGTFAADMINKPALQSYFWNNISIFIVAATVSIFLLIKKLFAEKQFIINSRLYNVIALISNASFGIYLVHMIVLETLLTLLPSISIDNIFAIPLVTTITYTISLGVIMLIQRTPAKKYLAT
jgi:surface polysaccharide O-acyltransferase-like enzyme